MELLKLIAMDKEDLAILSTYCQDAVVKVDNMIFTAAEQQFVLTLNRYVWEKKGRKPVPERRQAVLHFNRVSSVKSIAIDHQKPEDILALLAVTFEAGELPAGELHLVFSGGSAIRLNVECIEVQLSDMDGAWRAKSHPVHEIE